MLNTKHGAGLFCSDASCINDVDDPSKSIRQYSYKDTINCYGGLKQISGTCYANAALNGIFLSKLMRPILLRELKYFYENDLKDDHIHKLWHEHQFSYCLSNKIIQAIANTDQNAYRIELEKNTRFQIARYAYMHATESFLCNVPLPKHDYDYMSLWMKQTLNIKTTTTMSEVETDGGIPINVFKAYFKSILRSKSYENSIEIIDDYAKFHNFIKFQSTFPNVEMLVFKRVDLKDYKYSIFSDKTIQYLDKHLQDFEFDHAVIEYGPMSNQLHNIVAIKCDGKYMLIDSNYPDNPILSETLDEKIHLYLYRRLFFNNNKKQCKEFEECSIDYLVYTRKNIELVNYDPCKPNHETSGGMQSSQQSYKKTNIRKNIHGRPRVIYKDNKQCQYILSRGKYIGIKDIRKL